jgi:hypothetical protein
MKSLLLILTLFTFCSCKLLHSKQTKKNQSVSSTKADSTKLVRKDSGSTTQANWTREIINFPVPGRDTNIYHFSTPVNNYYPSQIIHETGSFSRDEWYRLIDSMNKKRLDTAATVHTESKSSSTFKLLSFGDIAALSVVLLFLLLNFMKTKKAIP